MKKLLHWPKHALDASPSRICVLFVCCTRTNRSACLIFGSKNRGLPRGNSISISCVDFKMCSKILLFDRFTSLLRGSTNKVSGDPRDEGFT